MNQMNGMHELNNLDYGIIAIISASVLMGIIRGFVREAMSLVTWITASVLGVLYCEPVASYFTGISLAPVRLLLAFVLLVLLTLIVGGLISHLIVKLMKSSGFSITDRIVGTLFGLTRGTIIIAMIVLIAGSSTIVEAPLWKHSMLIPTMQPIAIWIKARLPEDLSKLYPKLKEDVSKNTPQIPHAE